MARFLLAIAAAVLEPAESRNRPDSKLPFFWSFALRLLSLRDSNGSDQQIQKRLLLQSAAGFSLMLRGLRLDSLESDLILVQASGFRVIRST